ncbi:uncharacterized protein NESG_00995 [Nematocida ausubeli]|uniref:non-specific serine/threonine protein kinase n=1 Tax=Nematocida ausubeli (strain ATCC PRA-371 / ERTm2) TaxID=1913371 RepID=A0A086J3X1_NEMA1|nr:uncharacterized protein NESG_00995 [Nematocida ausubeli]KAI5147801.1 TP53 regulating kinase [Nematocida ausubeli]KFG26839.1 hypothetical protein NESG_00995 [Nematocida ausubeli]
MESLSIGAEATVYRSSEYIIKIRHPKEYRIHEIDSSVRKSRTKLEKMLLKRIEHLSIAPKIFDMAVLKDVPAESICLDMQYAICMEYIKGNTLRDVLALHSKDRDIESILADVYRCIGQLHGQQIVHGDLTPNNIIISNGSIKIIDFGLGKISNKIEDKAVDLYVFERTLASLADVSLEGSYANVFAAYAEGNTQNGKDTLNKLKEVRKRGRKRELNAVG